VDWIAHFQPPRDPDDDPRPWPAPVVFEGKDHAILVLQLRERLGHRLISPQDHYLPLIHDRVGYQGEDRRANGTDRPTELSPFGEVVDDDDDSGLDGWTLQDELEEFRAKKQILRFEQRQRSAAA